MCLNCNEPCREVDESIMKTIDQTKPLVGSVKPYQRHYVFDLKSPWPSNIDELKDQNSIYKILNTVSKEKQGRSIVSAVHGINHIYEFPTRLSYDPSSMNLKDEVSNQSGSTLSGLAYIFVCVHRERDARCGSLGPLILDAFQSYIKKEKLESKVFAYGISHVGGHAFAGNCIIYHQQESLNGHWYGRVKPSHIQQIIHDHILNGKIIKDLWRGHYKG